MRLSLTHRFMLLFAGLCVLLVISIASISRYRFNSELKDYVHRRELANLQILSEDLAEYYQASGGWRFIPNDQHEWHRLVLASLLNEVSHERNAHNRPTPAPKNERVYIEKKRHKWHKRREELQQLLPRLQLVDANRDWLAGVQKYERVHLLTQTVTVNGAVVGMLRLEAPKIFKDGLEERFARAHLMSMVWIVGVAIVLALIAAWLMARNLSRPVLQLAKNVSSMRNGEFDVRSHIHRQDEIGQLAKDIDALAETLAANENFRRNAMADVSHELRTPIALLRTRVEAMQDGIVKTDASSLEALHANILRLTHLVDDLHQMAIADAGGLKLVLRPTDLRLLTHQLLDDWRDECEKAELKMRVVSEDTATDANFIVEADAERVRQILSNVIRNSIRYTDAGGEMQIRLLTNADAVVVCVEDSAPGVPKDVQSFLFDRFFRVEKSRSRASGGSGLGLSVVKTLMDAHKGRIEVGDSALGGLRLCLHFPYAQS